jgi:4-amino-4-deoxy-L-arabinose transferase-like glycosyltransferase
LLSVSQRISSKYNYIIVFSLFLGSFLIYSYNLEGQPWHGDEINYLGWAGNYINLINKGNLANPCLTSIDYCNLLYHIPAHGLTYSPIRMLLIGMPLDIKNQENGNFHNWSCYYFSCYDPHHSPTVEQMAAGRLLSPLFGSLTIVISFLIGKILFNRYIGIFASLLFLFYDLWLWYSRTIMTEVHYGFFAMLSMLLLLYSFQGRVHMKYLIASAGTFGFALTTKILSIEFSVLFLTIILFGILLKRQVVSVAGKSQISKTCLYVAVFFTTAVLSLFLTQPGFYQDPLKEIALMKTDMDNYNRTVWYIGYPNIHGLQLDRVVSLFHYLLFPSFIEKQLVQPQISLSGNLDGVNPPTYSTIPLSIFFFVGFGYIVNRIRKLMDCSSEIILVVWFVSTFISSLLIARDFSLERYFLPLTISIIFISAYGSWRFAEDISNRNLRIIFAICFLFAHSVTAMAYWQKIYFSPGTMWVNPLHYGTLQESLDNSLAFVVNMTFIAFLFSVLVIRFQKRVRYVMR